MTQFMDAETVETIAVWKIGQIDTEVHNQRVVKCRVCRQEVEVGKGYHFRAQRYSNRSSGYYCHACVGEFIRSYTPWAYNPFTGMLMNIGSAAPLDRAALIKAWEDAGADGLYTYIRSLKEAGN